MRVEPVNLWKFLIDSAHKYISLPVDPGPGTPFLRDAGSEGREGNCIKDQRVVRAYVEILMPVNMFQ